MPCFSLEGSLAGKTWTIDAAELSRLGCENAPLGCAQAKSDKEMGELRAQFAQEQMKQAMAELLEALKREIAALRGEFMEQLSDLREQLAIVKDVKERAKSEETAGLRGSKKGLHNWTARSWRRHSGTLRRVPLRSPRATFCPTASDLGARIPGNQRLRR
jgi:hypothetical protein